MTWQALPEAVDSRACEAHQPSPVRALRAGYDARDVAAWALQRPVCVELPTIRIITSGG